jgi:hypothetical protein
LTKHAGLDLLDNRHPMRHCYSGLGGLSPGQRISPPNQIKLPSWAINCMLF